MTGPAPSSPTEAVVAALTPLDLEECAREPIHIPGSIQPRGVLLVVREPDMVVLQASANVRDVIGVDVDTALGRPLAEVVGTEAADVIVRFAESFSDLRARNPVDLQIEIDGEVRAFDAILGREPHGLLMIELEIADGPRPFSFPNTYQAVRGAVAELNSTVDIAQLYEITARAVRELTGFDRVMVYRYDHEYNGEVVADAKRDDLNSFLGLHYPATDIPAQARALYEKNWIRLISDVDYEPSPIVPTLNPVTDAPLDLTHATLRSVSPIHVEYLRNMGVGASMSISLLRDGSLWGLIACHQYGGPHTPPFGTRAAAEFLGSTLSLRLVDRVADDEYRSRLASQAVLATLAAVAVDERVPVSAALLGRPDLLALIDADGVVVRIDNDDESRGRVPDREVTQAVVRWARQFPGPVVTTDRLQHALPDVDVPSDVASGALVLALPDDRYVVWYRGELLHAIDWGGDPHNKALAVREGDSVRVSPRKSFERWSEIVRNRSLPWTSGERELADQLRRVVVEAMFQRARGELRLAETLQLNLQPHTPELTDWELSAHYEPADGGRIGGDWYDALVLRDGRLVTVLGDVAGHGIAAAGTMAQLRNVLRAHLHDGVPLADAVAKTNEFTVRLLPGAFATVVVVSVDLATGAVEAVSAGHPLPLLVAPGVEPSTGPVTISPPVGVRGVSYQPSRFVLDPGVTMVLFSDGLIERRGEPIDVGRQRLADALAPLGSPQAHDVRAAALRDSSIDDATVVTLRRPAD